MLEIIFWEIKRKIKIVRKKDEKKRKYVSYTLQHQQMGCYFE